jgi:hypothetical protein
MPTAMQELLSQPVMLPSPFLEQVAAGFADRISEFKKVGRQLGAAGLRFAGLLRASFRF